MCRLRNIDMRDYQESVTTGQTDRQTDARQSHPYVRLCFAGDTIRVAPSFHVWDKSVAGDPYLSMAWMPDF